MRFEKEKPNVTKYKLTYNEEDTFNEIHTVRVPKRPKRNTANAKETPYSLPKAYDRRLPISEAKMTDLLELSEDLTIPRFHHSFYINLPIQENERNKDDSSGSEEVDDSEDE